MTPLLKSKCFTKGKFITLQLISKYLGPRMLEEYEIQMEDLQIKSVNNISQAIVKFVFRRRIEYHVTKTFLQVGIKRLDIWCAS